MSYAVKNKVLIWAVLLLLIANIATLTTFWLGRGRLLLPPPEQPADYITRELNFNNLQKEQFMKLVQDHRKQVESLRKETKVAKDHFFDLLRQDHITDSTKKLAAESVSLLTQQLDLLTFDHFQKVRNICTADQQEKFDAIISDVLNMVSGVGAGRSPRPGGPPPRP